jgi:hypothetical protein
MVHATCADSECRHGRARDGGLSIAPLMHHVETPIYVLHHTWHASEWQVELAARFNPIRLRSDRAIQVGIAIGAVAVRVMAQCICLV